MSTAQLDDDEAIMASRALDKHASCYICLFKEHLAIAEGGCRMSDLTRASECFGDFISLEPMGTENYCGSSTKKARYIAGGNGAGPRFKPGENVLIARQVLGVHL
jgi:hypothetical protein